MKAITYRLSDGEITGIHVNNGLAVRYDAETEGVIYGALADPAINYIDPGTNSILTRDASQRPATWEQIKAKRNALEVAPITLDNGLTYDYDQQAKLRFETALAQFDNLPTLVDGKLTWKLSDNSFHPHTKAELQAAYDELQAKTAIRAAQLFMQAEVLAAGNHTVADIEDLTNWGLY